jgi:hypothetical protein
MWRSLAARLLWEQEAPGSNPGIPTKVDRHFRTNHDRLVATVGCHSRSGVHAEEMSKASSGSICFDHRGSACRDKYHRRCTGRWRAQISLGVDPETGKRLRPALDGTTRGEVRVQIDKLRAERVKGVKPRAGNAVEQAMDDYLDHLEKLDLAAKTISTYTEALARLRPQLHGKLVELNSDGVRAALNKVAADHSSRAV